MAGKTYEMTHEIAYYECDYHGYMTLTAFILLMIQVSEKQSIALDVSDEVMHQRGLGWVITQYEADVKRMPRLEEKVTFKTQATAYNRFFCYRDFWAYAENGEELVHITAIFVMLSFETRSMVSLLPDILDVYGATPTKKLARLAKPAALVIEEAKQQSYRVRYFDIDNNRHVNNARYFDWMLDSLGFEFLASHELRGFSIKYEKEVAYGEEIASCYQILSDEAKVRTIHQVRVGDRLCAEAEYQWQKRVED